MSRRPALWLYGGLVLTLLLNTSCFRVLKLFSVEMGNLSAVNGASSAGKYIILEDESSDYADNKDKIKSVEEYTLLGTIQNNLSAPVSADVWIVEGPASPALLSDLAAVQAAGGVKILTVALGADETKDLQWGRSNLQIAFEQLFNPGASDDPVIRELEGDGVFTLYVFGSTSTYDVTVTNAQFVVTVYVDA